MSDCDRIIKTIAIIYACIAILYTTSYFLASPLRASLPLLLNLSSVALPNSSVSSILIALNRQERFNLHGSQNSFAAWDPSNINSDLFLSKAFSNSLHPSKIIPFFYRAFGTFESDDITITTLITSNRFPVFARLVERYRGTLSISKPNIYYGYLNILFKAPYLSLFTSRTISQIITSC